MINSATEYGFAMHDAFSGGANVWMAYDWVYPPRDSGEALIHIDWGKDYRLTKPYHLIRQWAEPLTPGMRVVQTSVTGQSGVKPTSFLASGNRTLVVHVVNPQDKDVAITLKATGKFATGATVARTRTSAKEDVASLPALKGKAGVFSDTIPARSMATFRFDVAGR